MELLSDNSLERRLVRLEIMAMFLAEGYKLGDTHREKYDLFAKMVQDLDDFWNKPTHA